MDQTPPHKRARYDPSSPWSIRSKALSLQAFSPLTVCSVPAGSSEPQKPEDQPAVTFSGDVLAETLNPKPVIVLTRLGRVTAVAHATCRRKIRDSVRRNCSKHSQIKTTNCEVRLPESTLPNRLQQYHIATVSPVVHHAVCLVESQDHRVRQHFRRLLIHVMQPNNYRASNDMFETYCLHHSLRGKRVVFLANMPTLGEFMWEYVAPYLY